MGEYTRGIEYSTKDIDRDFDELDDESIIVLLTEQVKKFRTFDEAITEFILNHGFSGDTKSDKDRIDFISRKFMDAGIPIPRFIKEWFTQKKSINKSPTGYQFCFAFHLGIDESNDFFRRICLERGINCHDIQEAVYYYCLKNKESYSVAQNLIENVKNTEGGLCNNDVPYTNVIRHELDKICSIEGLKNYLKSNYDYFSISKKRATENIIKLWDEISAENGIANKELSSNYVYFDCWKEGDESKERSRWILYKQIVLGQCKKENKDNISVLDDKIEKERSIKYILKKNPMFHKLAEKDFPNREAIDKLLGGKRVSDESARKLLILLSFYTFWAKKAIKRGFFDSEDGEGEDCKIIINNILTESEYQGLYYGNPYDWIFLFSMYQDAPLETFRFYMNCLKLTVFNE